MQILALTKRSMPLLIAAQVLAGRAIAVIVE
jgi:hypothetical protein